MSETANLRRHDYLFSISDLNTGMISSFTMSPLFSSLATTIELLTAEILTESLSSLRRSIKIGNRYSLAHWESIDWDIIEIL